MITVDVPRSRTGIITPDLNRAVEKECFSLCIGAHWLINSLDFVMGFFVYSVDSVSL
jgi:hypothetical protein